MHQTVAFRSKRGGGGGTSAINMATSHAASSQESWPIRSLSLTSATWPSHSLSLTYTVSTHTHTHTHAETHSHTLTLLVGRDCVTLTLTAAGLSFINASFRSIICCALHRTEIIQVICGKNMRCGREMDPSGFWSEKGVFSPSLHIEGSSTQETRHCARHRHVGLCMLHRDEDQPLAVNWRADNYMK